MPKRWRIWTIFFNIYLNMNIGITHLTQKLCLATNLDYFLIFFTRFHQFLMPIVHYCHQKLINSGKKSLKNTLKFLWVIPIFIFRYMLKKIVHILHLFGINYHEASSRMNIRLLFNNNFYSKIWRIFNYLNMNIGITLFTFHKTSFPSIRTLTLWTIIHSTPLFKINK